MNKSLLDEKTILDDMFDDEQDPTPHMTFADTRSELMSEWVERLHERQY